jgi:SAM-dependent methyltransferase
MVETFAWPLALRMAAAADVGAGERVLDVGCGIGDPTLQVAVLVGPHGRVVGVDLVASALEAARERARALALGHVEFVDADVTTMVLAPATFDVVLGRWSVIYLDDVVGTLARLREALAPGGRIAVSAWAPADANPWLAIPAAVLPAVGESLPLDPTRPGILHLSGDGALARALVEAGYQSVGQERVQLSYFAHDVHEFWESFTDAAGPLGALAARLDDERLREVERRLGDALRPHRAGEVLRIPAQAQLAWGRA